eukprot:Rmarinus@m.7915
MRGYRRGGHRPWTLLLGLNLMHRVANLRYKPPVTLGLMFVALAFFFAPGELGIPSISDACLNPFLIKSYRDFSRLILPAFYHSSDFHLFSNLGVLLWVGVRLEGHLGSEAFIILYFLLLFASHAATVFVAAFFLELSY